MGVQERRAREKQARQEAILDAAQTVFFAKGLDQTVIDDIAEEAELSKGTIYLYFQSKEELYVSVFLRGLDILSNQFQHIKDRFETSGADELLREARDIYYEFFIKYPEYFYINSLFYHGRIKDKISSDIWEATNERAKECLEVVSAIFEKGISEGMFRDIDCWKTAISFWGAATGVMMILEDEVDRKLANVSEKEMLDYMVEFLMKGLKT